VPGANARIDEEEHVTFVEALRCRECGKTYPVAALHVCDHCFGPLEVTYDYDAIKANISREQIEKGPQTIWRYAA
jgi:threonine synthase